MPRQAARTPKGRERLMALLGEFDRRAESGPEATREALRDVRRQLKMEQDGDCRQEIRLSATPDARRHGTVAHIFRTSASNCSCRAFTHGA
jgi:hypothetical protein